MSVPAPALAFAPFTGVDEGEVLDAGLVLHALAMAILVVDGDNRIRYANAAGTQFLGVNSIGRV